MKKRRIVIASVLKPVDDTRMLDKMGRTLQASGEDEIYIVGYPSERNPDGAGITLIPFKNFKRISLSRLLAPFKVLILTFEVRPDILIVNTHELLIVGCLNRIFFGTHIFYDVRENYYRNLRFSNAFPAPFRMLLALWVRTKEKATAPFFRGFFLAEKGYQKEMNFFGRRATILENKAVILPGFERKNEPGVITLLFTGTLAESTGIFDAIRLAKRLHAVTRSIRLRIVGSCIVYETLKKINSEIRESDFISLVGGSRLVPHEEIVKAIYSANFGIICYPKSPHTENAIPTKLYEYLSYSLPILLQPNPAWVDLCAPSHACIPVDFQEINDVDLLERMQSEKFYTIPAVGTTWESEGEKLIWLLEDFSSDTGLGPSPRGV